MSHAHTTAPPQIIAAFMATQVSAEVSKSLPEDCRSRSPVDEVDNEDNYFDTGEDCRRYAL
jgi:hypothetical protein